MAGIKDTLGGVVLCGGQSRRMGYPKALLPFGNEVLLQRVVRRLADSVGQIVVVKAADQTIPELSAEIELVIDDQPDLGPLQGIACGLSALQSRCDFAFVMSCDAPFTSAAFIERMFELRVGKEIAITIENERLNPLSAIYSTSLALIAADLLSKHTRRPIALLDHATNVQIPVESLRSVDPHLASLQNVNDPSAYVAALAAAGLPLDPEIAVRLGIDRR